MEFRKRGFHDTGQLSPARQRCLQAKSPRNGKKKKKKKITSQKDTKLKGQELIFYLFIYFYHNRHSQKTVRNEKKISTVSTCTARQHTTLPTTYFFRYLFLRTPEFKESLPGRSKIGHYNKRKDPR